MSWTAIVTAAASAAIWTGVLNRGHEGDPDRERYRARPATSGWSESSDGAWPQTLNGELRVAW